MQALEQATLVHRCVSGEPDAWRALHTHYRPIAGAFLRKLGVEGEELEDACQEVFLQMFRYLPRFRGEAQIKTWLYRLCVTSRAGTHRFVQDRPRCRGLIQTGEQQTPGAENFI